MLCNRSSIAATFLTLLCTSALADDEPQDVFFGDDKGSQPLSERMTDKGKGKTIVTYVNGCKYKEVEFQEKERHSRFYEDVRALLGHFTDPSPKPAAVQQCPVWERWESKRLQYPRSTVTLTAVPATDAQKKCMAAAVTRAAYDKCKTDAAKAAAAKAKQGDGKGKEDGKDDDAPKMTVITGPKEHAYLGIDLPVTQRKQLKYDSASGTLQPRNENPQLYLSFNWYFGDLAGKQDNSLRGLTIDRVSLKALMLVDSRPLDSVGLGLGYRLPKLDLVDLSSFNLFLGRFWTKQDAVSSTGTPETNAATGRDWRLGVSYDIGAGVKLLKSN